MASLMRVVIDNYYKMLSKGDPRVEDWPLMSTPWPSVAICLLYVIVIRQSSQWMQHRPAYELRSLMLVYNMGMILLSGWLVLEFLACGWLTGYSLGCQPVDFSRSPQAMRMAVVCWWFYMSKFFELADTVFFVLRKKFNLITFLHVFHHAIMPASWWFVVKLAPGGFTTFHALLNSFIHFLMYTYYALAAGGPRFERFLWWKRYMTKAQLLQFAVVTIHSCQLFFIECDYPTFFAVWILSYAVIFFGLFINFYIQAYLRKPVGKSRHVANGDSHNTPHDKKS